VKRWWASFTTGWTTPEHTSMNPPGKKLVEFHLASYRPIVEPSTGTAGALAPSGSTSSSCRSFRRMSRNRLKSV
jgi:hypothetical protein